MRSFWASIELLKGGDKHFADWERYSPNATTVQLRAQVYVPTMSLLATPSSLAFVRALECSLN